MAPGLRRWQRFNASLTKYIVSSDVTEALLSIPILPLTSRKQLLKIARCQCSPEFNSFLRSQTPMYLDSNLVVFQVNPQRHKTYQLKWICRTLSGWVHNNLIRSSILSVLVRSAPVFLSNEECAENALESWWKEINATQGPDRPQKLDYSVWFSDDADDALNRLGPHLPLCPNINTRIRNSFTDLRISIASEDIIYYPQLTTEKHIGRASAFKFMERTAGPLTEIGVSVVDLEKYYAETGIVTGGPEELRQSWKYNDLTPRSYFAQGASSFHSSKYIREIANRLCNAFPQTNFVSRYSINRLVPTERTTCFTYDYSSFTSNLTELKYYLWALSSFFAGVMITVLDSHIGLLSQDLGDVLRQYTDTCAYHPQFTLNRLLPMEYQPLIHKRGGCLGQYGNIVTSTNLHGLHACNVCGETGDCNCVGDDVIGYTGEDMDDVKDAVLELGEVNPQKVREWPYLDPMEEDLNDQRSWPYTKRPLDRVGNRLNLLPALFMPILGEAMEFEGDKRSRSELSREERIKIIVSQIRVLYSTLAHSTIQFEEEDLSLIHEYLISLYDALQIKRKGALPTDVCTYNGDAVRGILVPNLDRFYEFDIWAGLEEDFSAGVHSVPVLSNKEPSPSRGILFTGHAVGRMTRELNYLHRMEYIKATPMYHERYFPDFFSYQQFMNDLLLGYETVAYDFSVIWIPDHIAQSMS